MTCVTGRKSCSLHWSWYSRIYLGIKYDSFSTMYPSHSFLSNGLRAHALAPRRHSFLSFLPIWRTTLLSHSGTSSCHRQPSLLRPHTDPCQYCLETLVLGRLTFSFTQRIPLTTYGVFIGKDVTMNDEELGGGTRMNLKRDHVPKVEH